VSGFEALPRTRTERLLRYPSAVLLAIQMTAVVIYPYVGTTETGRAALSIIGTVVLGFAIWTVRQARGRVLPAILLGVVALLLSVAEVSVTRTDLTIASDVVHAVFYFYVTYALVRYLFGDDWVTRDDLFAVGAAFTVLAWGFAYVFDAVQQIHGDAFIANGGLAQRSWFELLYLSFANLTSVGLSDIVPVVPAARGWSIIEQILGVLYVAMVISRMVALTVRRGL
jgi:hypothetical protein